MLIVQLNRYPSKIGADIPDIISERNILDVKCKKNDDGSLAIECGFSCPLCDKVTKVIYSGYWQASNATKHLKKHVDEAMRDPMI